MKKRKLAMLALLGINMGLFLNTSQLSANESMTPQMHQFYEQLSPEGKRQFLQLDSEHRQAAISTANQGCNSPHGCGTTNEEAVQEQYNSQMQGK